jgi:hypothetical protein
VNQFVKKIHESQKKKYDYYSSCTIYLDGFREAEWDLFWSLSRHCRSLFDIVHHRGKRIYMVAAHTISKVSFSLGELLFSYPQVCASLLGE